MMTQEAIKPNVYSGKARVDPRFGVYKNGVILDCAPSQRIINHSPDGFSWGYLGSGCAQLALALLFDVIEHRDIATMFYQDFKCDVVANWPMNEDWTITREAILKWLDKRMVEAEKTEKRGGAV